MNTAKTFALFPHRVRAIVRDRHGLNLVLPDALGSAGM